MFEEYLPNISRIECSEIVINKSSSNLWHYSVLNADNIAIAGGYSLSKNQALRIAVAEHIERSEFLTLNSSPRKKDYCLDTHPTTCGFAAGFSEHSTRKRSISEAIERWCWSKWIDEKFFIQECFPDELGIIGDFVMRKFDSVKFFKQKIQTSHIIGFPKSGYFYVSLAFKGNGVFPGSRFDSNDSYGWSHSLMESWRHSLINDKLQCPEQINRFPNNRIHHFGKSASSVISLLSENSKRDWSIPKLYYSKLLVKKNNQIFVWRSLMQDYLGWDKGSHERFVY